MTIKALREKRAACLAKAKEIHDKPEITADEVKAAQAALDDASGLKAQIEQAEALEKELAELNASTGRKTKTETVEDGGVKAKTTSLRDRIMDDPKRGFSGIGEFALQVAGRSIPGSPDASETFKMYAAATDLNQATGADGGFLVPPSFANEVWDGLNREPDNLLAMTDSYTIQGESLTFPANAETSRATGSRYGGVQGYWIAEAAQIAHSKPTFRQVTLRSQELAVLVYVTEKLMRNSPIALSQYLTRASSQEINFLVGDAIINGSGAGQPKGILNGTSGQAGVARIAITKETGQAAKTIVKENIDKMYAAMHIKCLQRAVWLINQDVLPQLQQLSAVVGVGGVPVYLPPGQTLGNITESPNARLYGRPVIPIEYAATVGTEGDIIFADMKSYATGTKGTINEAMSMHLRFDFAETAFRFMYEVDGQTWTAAPITPYKGTQKVSPFVTLAAR